MPETCKVFFDKIKFGKFVRLVGFIKKKRCYLLILHNKTQVKLLFYLMNFNVCSADVFEQLDLLVYPK